MNQLLEAFGIKSLLAAFVSFGIYLAGIMNEAMVILLFFMLLDMITGLLRGLLTKSLNSTIGLAGIIKKFAIIVIIAMTGGIEFFLLFVGQDSKGLIVLATISFFVVNEGISILENCAQLGLPIPPFLFNALEKLHRDPEGKEVMVQRDPSLDKVDKRKLIKEVQQLKGENTRPNKNEE